MATKFNVGYTPNDFYYVDAALNSDRLMPDESGCGNLILNGNTYSYSDPVWQDVCENNFIDNSFNCIQQQLCVNKDKAKKLQVIDSTHNGADKNYVDSKLNYEMTIMDIINLGIGIVLTIIIIYKNRNIL